MIHPSFAAWMQGLEERHLASLTLAEVARALRALSSCYVERRARLPTGAALEGAGKRAAFALFYGPLHYLVTRHIVQALGAPSSPIERIVDLGCGTGAAGAAWAASLIPHPRVVGIDRHPWSVGEANWTYRALGLTGRARIKHVRALPRLDGRTAVVLAYAANEFERAVRDRLMTQLFSSRPRAAILVVEPIARGAAPWWHEWVAACVARGGRAHQWRFRPDLPPVLQELDRRAGLDHREVSARSLWLG